MSSPSTSVTDPFVALITVKGELINPFNRIAQF